MKKRTIWLAVYIFLILFLGGSIVWWCIDSPQRGLLKMDGVGISSENVMIHRHHAELPLTEVMKSLGMNVYWIDRATAEITYKDKRYTLSLSEVSLTEDGQNANFLLPPPGGKRCYTVLERELILDSNTIKSALYQMGIKINIDINRKEQIVTLRW